MNAAYSRKLQVVVLAAGFSFRFGRPKPLARLHGLSLLRRALKLASGLRTERVSVVVPRNAARYRIEGRGIKVRWVANLRRAQGLSGSVRAGLAEARYSAAVLLMPVDLTQLKSREMLRLVRRWQATPRRLIARRIDLAGATPLILPRWLYPRALKVTGAVGLRELVAQLPADSRVLVEMPSAARDVDTPQDLQDARRRFRPGA
ncbi:MAG TPA: nucleotidyltransferase family protein [Steroidobacteraceae bacterium]|jgi:molybdenum cofactor cytidylyltransferase|nr:nucleotidyltransferase family protein [Steroidobacteraceae bacterium]